MWRSEYPEEEKVVSRRPRLSIISVCEAGIVVRVKVSREIVCSSVALSLCPETAKLFIIGVNGPLLFGFWTGFRASGWCNGVTPPSWEAAGVNPGLSVRQVLHLSPEVLKPADQEVKRQVGVWRVSLPTSTGPAMTQRLVLGATPPSPWGHWQRFLRLVLGKILLCGKKTVKFEEVWKQKNCEQ